MKKLLLATLVSATTLSTATFALAYPMQGGGYGGCGNCGMQAEMNCMQNDQFEPTVESITQRVEQRLAMRGNQNIKLDSVTEKDGKFIVRITTLDGDLVNERIIDPNNPQPGYMNAEPLTLDRAKEFIEGHLAMRGNPNIKLGEIKEKDGLFVATITTKKGSLVNEITIDPQNPHGSFMQNGRGGKMGMGMNRGGRMGGGMGGHHGGR